MCENEIAFPADVVVNLRSSNEEVVFLRVLNSIGYGDFIRNSFWKIFGRETCVEFNSKVFLNSGFFCGARARYENLGVPIISLEDFLVKLDIDSDDLKDILGK